VSSVTDVFWAGSRLPIRCQFESHAVELERSDKRHLPIRRHQSSHAITDNAALNVTFAYDATNKLTSRTLPNGVVSTYQYDGLDRLTRLTHAKAPNTLADFQYQFNSVNNITQMIDTAGTHNYSYDTLDRLTAATHPNQPNESYTFDDVGNTR
jgi:YD repeat-containing protein